MKITHDMKDAMNVLAQEFALRTAMGMNRPQVMGRVWNSDKYPNRRSWERGGYDEPIMHTLGMTFSEMVEALGAKHDAGVNTQTIIFPGDGVIKWSKQGGIRSHIDTDEDARFYHKIVEEYPQYATFLAETIQIGRFTVQEPITVAYDSDIIADMNDDDRFDIYANLIRAAFDLGLRDVHMSNWGFRKDDPYTPVIFDFSDRRPMRSTVTMDRLNAQFSWNSWSNGDEYMDVLENMLDELNQEVDCVTDDSAWDDFSSSLTW